jgi:hypothetical protein
MQTRSVIQLRLEQNDPGRPLILCQFLTDWQILDANTGRRHGRNGTASQGGAGTIPNANQQGSKLVAFESFDTQAHDGGRTRAAHGEQGMKVRIEGNNGAAVLLGMLENALIACRCQTNIANVKRSHPCCLNNFAAERGKP